jgi:hypothetical protein
VIGIKQDVEVQCTRRYTVGTIFEGTHPFKLNEKDRACVFVHKDLLLVIKLYANKNNMSIREATHILIQEGIKHLWSPDFKPDKRK